MFLFKKKDLFSYKNSRKLFAPFSSFLNPILNPCIVDVNMEKMIENNNNNTDLLDFSKMDYSNTLLKYSSNEPNSYTIVFLAFIGFGIGFYFFKKG